MKKLRAVSLFSNCGAGDIGYRNAGFEFEVMAELDPRRLEVCLLNHQGAVGVPGDLRETWRTVVEKYRSKSKGKSPALLCACPPCQGMSSARSGKGSHDDPEAGSKDKRNLLVTVVTQVALELKPEIIVVENVPAFFSRKVHHPDDGMPVSAANYLISALSNEYIPFPLITDLSDFGIPQSRSRAFLTLIRKDVSGLATLANRALSPFPNATHVTGGEYEKPVTIMDALDSFSLPTLDAKSSEAATAPEYNGFHTVPVWSDRIYSMVAAIPKSTGLSAWSNKNCHACGPVDVSSDAITCPTCGAPLLRPIVLEDGKYRFVKGFKSSYRRMHAMRPAATITTASGHIGSDYTIHPIQNRLLSPIECSILQTFPSDFNWGDALKKYGHSNIREMIGEAVPPAFTEKHGKILRGVLVKKHRIDSMPQSDQRCLKGWSKLSNAAKKDGRQDPKDAYQFPTNT